MGCTFLWRLRSQPDPVFSFAEFLALDRVAAPGGLLHDVANVVVEYADPGDGAGSSARASDGRVLHDVYGHGSFRCFPRRSIGRPSGRALNGFHGRSRLHRRRSVIRITTAEDQG